MNKLYIINWTLRDGFIISVSTFWSLSALREKMDKNKEWNFETVRDDDAQMVIIAS